MALLPLWRLWRRLRRTATRSCPSRSGARPNAGCLHSAPTDVIVVGDTPHDVACAQAVGAVSVGVATGGFTADQLRDCGAAVVFETLEDTDGFARLL